MATNKIKKLIVTTPQGESGVLHRESRYSFNYTTGERAREVALGMPIRAESYSSGALPIPFAMNKPEGYLLDKLVSRFAKIGGLDDMKLLSIVGDNQIGRLTYHDPNSMGRKLVRPQVGLKELLQSHPTQSLFDFLVDTYVESGISGVQPKVMVPDGDNVAIVDSKATVLHANLIVKADGDEYPFLTQNEFLCMEAARCSGILVPKFWLSEDSGLFIMERFDLKDGKTMGFEDMSVVTGKQPDDRGEYKYQSSYENIAKAIQLYCGNDAIENMQRLFEYVALSVMVRNGDAHLKNFGLLYEHPDASQAPSLAPLYDVVTTKVYLHVNPRTGVAMADPLMALNMNKEKKYPTREALLRFGADTCHVSKPQQVIEKIGAAMSQTLVAHRERIDEKFFDLLSAEWSTGRMSAEPSRFFMTRGGHVAPDDCVSSGHFSGAILTVETGVVTQKYGRDPSQIARHDAGRISRLPVVGEIVDIKYQDGVGRVSERDVGIDQGDR